MKNKNQPKGLIGKKLEDPEYRKLQEERYAAFKLEAQILRALEKKGWTYSDLAKATNTYKSNISRDLKAGGILTASLSRISNMAEALGMKLIALLVPKEHEPYMLLKIEELVRMSSSAACVDVKLIEPSSFTTDFDEGYLTNPPPDSFTWNIQTEGLVQNIELAA